MVDVSRNLIKSQQVRIKLSNPNPEFQISTEFLTWKVAHQFISSDIQDDSPLLKFLKQASSAALKEAFDKAKAESGVNGAQPILNVVNGVAQLTADDQSLFSTAYNTFKILFPKMTLAVWKEVSEEDALRAIDEELAVLNSNKKQSRITEETAEEMTNDTPLTKSTIKDMFDAEMSKLRKEVRSNSSGGPKTQRAPKGNAGQSSRRKRKGQDDDSQKDSNHQPPKKKSKKDKAKKKQNSKKKKPAQQQQQQQPHQEQQQQRSQRRRGGRGRGGRGGANSGGRGRGNQGR